MLASSVIELPAMPPASAMRRLAVRGTLRRTRPTDLDGTTLLVRGVAVQIEELSAYNRVCGFRLGDALPPTYPHVLAFPLSMRLMTEPSFPYPVIGLIHVANAITQTRPISIGEPLDISVRAADLRPHERGTQFDIVASASVGDVEVWRGVSTYLRRSNEALATLTPPSTPPAQPAGDPTVTWRPTRDVGTQYARVSGDRNPIHTSRFGAMTFGFPGPIAHGMWTMAQCLSTLEGRLPPGHRAEVAFKRPILLPSTIGLWARPEDGGWDLDVANLSAGTPHLTGTVRALA